MDKVNVDLLEMTPIMLDWAAAIAIGHAPYIRLWRGNNDIVLEDWNKPDTVVKEAPFNPTTNDAHCGILIDRYCLTTCKINPDLDDVEESELGSDYVWVCASYDSTVHTYGPDRKIAAVRNIVLAELGQWVDVPLALVER